MTKIRNLKLKLLEVYRDIARRAPLAQIRIINYPVAVSPTRKCRLGLSDKETELFFNAAIALNNEIYRAAVQMQREVGSRVFVVNAFAEFEGHDACADPLRGENWMNGAEVPFPWIDKNEFFHINARGHAAIARLVAATLER